jgi:hypothetical protein
VGRKRDASGRMRLGKVRLGRRETSGATRGVARRARRRGATAFWLNSCCWASVWKWITPFFFNTSASIVEYESWRSTYPLPLSKRLYRVFLNRFCRRDLPTLNVTHLSWTGGTDLWASFSCFSTQNLKCQSTWKLCPSTSWTAFIKVDFEVFRWNLENAAKVPKDICGY